MRHGIRIQSDSDRFLILSLAGHFGLLSFFCAATDLWEQGRFFR